MPILVSSPCALRAYKKRFKVNSKAKGTPFNLKEGGREASPRAVNIHELVSPKWVGPWIDLGPRGGLSSGISGRFFSYAMNT